MPDWELPGWKEALDTTIASIDYNGRHHTDADEAERVSAATTLGSPIARGLMIVLWRAPLGLTHWQMDAALSEIGVPATHSGCGAVRNALMLRGYILPSGVVINGPYGHPNEIFQALPPRWLSKHYPRRVPAGRKRSEPCTLHIGERPAVRNDFAQVWESRCITCGVLLNSMTYVEATERTNGAA